MISVGLDIPRLGLMVVLGQPKTRCRVHPGHQPRRPRPTTRPGLVVTLLNIHKPRDRSHYERFRHYHETFYRSVEVASVTPFSARALDRGFAGALVALARHAAPAADARRWAPSRSPTVRAELERRLLELFRPELRAAADCRRAEREERLASVQSRIVDLLDSWRQDHRRLPSRHGVAAAVPAVRAETGQAAAAGDARHGLRVRAPPEVPRQPLAARRRAEREPVPEGSERRPRWRTSDEPCGHTARSAAARSITT